jgi:hypothetical protein
MREELIRQYDVIPENILETQITIIGAGAIGSFTCLALAKMGFIDITVYDDDEVNIENMNAQFYPTNHLGDLKVNALMELVHPFGGCLIENKVARYKGEIKHDGIVISAVDSMSARKLIWDSHKDNPGTQLIIDPRMAAEYGRIFAMDPNSLDDMKSYEKTLHSDEQAIQERCTAKSTIYTVLLMSGAICKIVKDFLTNQNYCRITDWAIGNNSILTWNKDGSVSNG